MATLQAVDAFDVDDFNSDELTPDTQPLVTGVEYPCRVCNREAGPYSGRGRKPTLCAEHKAQTKGSGGRATKTTGKAAQLAGQAADTLSQYNDIVAFVAGLGTLEFTKEQIETANPEFRDRAYAALLTDPALAESIIRNGGMSGKAALIIAYAMFAGSVVPVAMGELKIRKAERDARRQDELGE